ncbi:hypothetical protein ACIPD2_08595 [Streptomyces griseofuscus]
MTDSQRIAVLRSGIKAGSEQCRIDVIMCVVETLLIMPRPPG